ncbi:MAG TPA: HAMP domain-containing sensor histidine kinase [Nocardioidaceae bacterium]|nr:HAMP domain-containing sensor histidine kinase [Nocardioidaceae bacterium]
MTTEPRPAASAGLTVRTRIAVSVAVLVGLALAGAGLVVYALESARIERGVGNRVEQELAEFATLRDEGIDPGARPVQGFSDIRTLVRTFLQRNVPDDDELLVGWWDGGPKVVSDQVHEPLVFLPEFVDLVQQRVDRGGTARIDTEWGEVVVTVQPVQDPARSGAFVIANFLAAEHEELNRVMQTYAIVSALSLGLVTAIAAWQAGRLLRPVRTLRETAEEITVTDLSRRIPESGHDDVSALTRTFNEMLGRLDDAFTGQRQFLDDAGHELKTPLTVIRGHLELLDSGDPAEVEATRTLLLEEIDRMSRLVGDLIMLAKTARPDFLQYDAVGIGPLTGTVLEKCRALGDRAWVLDETVDTLAWVDEQRVTQAMLELAQNAVKHTEPGAEIGVGSRGGPHDDVLLWVRDPGHGIPDEDKPLVFERFGRSAVPKGDEGFGLGLSIVRAIAHAHGGTVHVEDEHPQGSRFILTLPTQRKDDTWLAS